jgi:hypothetical protein
MQGVRTVVRTLIAVFLALAGPVLAAPAVRAYAQEVQQSSQTNAASSHQLTVSIDGMSPNFATPASTIKVSGTLTNHTGSAVAGIVVQLLTSPYPFNTRSSMDSFAGGGSYGYLLPEGTGYSLNGTLPNGATAAWTVSFSAAQAGYSAFGVYPIEVQATSSVSSYQATDHTFLPFWPASERPKQLDTAWIWPLIDQPQQGACSETLATNSLAGSLGTGGRLGRLLTIGQQWAQADRLTWAIDPALLSDASVMTRKYKVGGNAVCIGGAHKPASAAAAQWLDSLRHGAAGDEMFLTPYADTDVSALAHAGLDATLKAAYRVGKSVAAKILPGTFGKTKTATGDGAAAAIAWPTGGAADASVLTSLASDGGINTVILNSGELPSIDGPQFDDALGATTTGVGTRMNVLLADSKLTTILGSASAGSPAGAQFAAEQEFLAQTAMIAAEAPNEQRSIVIAPPRHWNPSAAEAGTLLSLTYTAPWLHKVNLSSLAADAGRLPARETLPGDQVSKTELSNGYLDQVSAVSASATLYKDLLYQPSAEVLQSIDAAVAATTSAAWRGTDSASGRLALTKLTDYLNDNERKVQLITGKKFLLAGTSGFAPVSVTNLGQLPVQVKVEVVPAGSALSVGKFASVLTVQGGKTGTVKIPVNSTAIGTTTMQLQLVTVKDGLPLGTAQSLSVEVTRYGRALLVLIAAALGVLVLASAARWLRRRQHGGRAKGRSGGTG